MAANVRKPRLRIIHPTSPAVAEDGTIPETARVLVVDSDEYGGVNHNQAIDSPAIELQGSSWVRINYDSFFTGNQDQSAGSWYQLDDGPWQPLVLFDNWTHGDDQAYAGPYSFAVNTEGASTITVRFWLVGNFSWLWAIDNFEVLGYTDVPPGPAQPEWLEPMGSMNPASITQFRSSAYSDSTGGTHVFSEWEVTPVEETWGNLVRFSSADGDFRSIILWSAPVYNPMNLPECCKPGQPKRFK